MFARTAAVLLLVCSGKAEPPSDKSWKNLGHTIKESTYTVALRDGRCVIGRIESFDDKYVSVGSVKLDRKDVLRVGDGSSVENHDLIYSGRSSWSDLERSEPNKYEHIQLELKNSATRDCRAFSSSDKGARCDGSPVETSAVTRGYYVRLAPATEQEQLAAHQNVMFLAPRTWFGFALFPRIKVLLYDAALPQENLKIACKVP